jgi:hypothetical protein
VLIRDGGHFKATFPDESSAQDFARKAMAWIMKDLPGLRAEYRLKDTETDADLHLPKGTQEERANLASNSALLPYGHPAWQVCQVFGDRPANDQSQYPANDQSQSQKILWISEDEQELEKSGANFREKPDDIIAILESANLIPNAKDLKDLSDISEQGYLALIHADGNSIGKRLNKHLKKWNSQGSLQCLEREAHAEYFFHRMRVVVRTALCRALGSVFGGDGLRGSYQLLMLGGDDLLLVCNAEAAFPFVIEYAKELAEPDLKLADGEPLTIGAGIAIAKDSFPFHRLHEAAEELASSAKQLYRACPQLGSVVDWNISTQSWIDDPLAERRALYGDSPLIGSARPYAILPPPIPSLETLFEHIPKAKQEMEGNALARSQLQAFQEILQRRDPALAELAWLEMPKGLRETLFKAGIKDWKTPTEDEHRFVSVVGDFVDLYELARLGRKPEERSA